MPKTTSLLVALLVVPLLTTTGFTPTHHPHKVYATTDRTANTANSILHTIQQTGLTTALSLTLLLFTATTTSHPAWAADFAGKDISGKDFSGQELVGKDFSKANAQTTNFSGANLQGANFAKANLVKADFTGAQLQKANFDDAILDGTILKDVLAQESSFSKTILDIGDLENADMTDALWPSK